MPAQVAQHPHPDLPAGAILAGSPGMPVHPTPPSDEGSDMSEPGAVWNCLRRERPMSTGRLVITGLALYAAMALVVRIAEAQEEEGGHGVTIYTREMGTGRWLRQHNAWDDQRGIMGALEDRVRRIFGLTPKLSMTTRRIGESHQASPGDVPYLAIPQVARFLPSDLGWSLQILVCDEPRRIADSGRKIGTSPGAQGRFWKATVVCSQAKDRADCRESAEPWFMSGGNEVAAVCAGPVRLSDLRRYWLYLDENDRVFAVTMHEIGNQAHADIDPGTMGVP
jgi:hypothetical protein